MPLVVCLLVLLASGSVLAAGPPGDSYHYRIRHAVFGEIGEHRVVVHREGERVVVEHRAHLVVKLLGMTAHERDSRYREVWQGERLVVFEGLTIDNGERFEVTAQAAGGRLMIEGSEGRVVAPAATVPSQPSLALAVPRGNFFDTKTGGLLTATVGPAGREWLKLGGEQAVETARFETTGGLEQTVWYAADGVFAQWRLWRQGAAITLTRD
jgi:hypothetical protein